MVFLKVSLLGYNKLIVLDIDAGVAAWTGGGGGGGSSPKYIIPTTKINYPDHTNPSWTFDYCLPAYYPEAYNRSDSLSAFWQDYTKETIGGEEHLVITGSFVTKSGSWSIPAGSLTVFETNQKSWYYSFTFGVGAERIITEYFYTNSTYNPSSLPTGSCTLAFMTKVFDFSNLAGSLHLGSPSIEYPIQVSAVVYSSDITTDSTGTDITFSPYSGAGGRTYTSSIGMYVNLQQLCVAFSSIPTNYYIGIKSNNNVVLWRKNNITATNLDVGNLMFYKPFFNFSSIFPNYY